jgi:hypothetical protein
VQWFRDEQFWRDVTKSAVSALIVAAIIYAFGLGAGTIPPPTSDNFAVNVLVVIGSIVLSLFLAALVGAVTNARFMVPRDQFGRAWFAAQPFNRRLGAYVVRALPWTVFVSGSLGISWALISWLAP